jgi:hypothetical protein
LIFDFNSHKEAQKAQGGIVFLCASCVSWRLFYWFVFNHRFFEYTGYYLLMLRGQWDFVVRPRQWEPAQVIRGLTQGQALRGA